MMEEGLASVQRNRPQSRRQIMPLITVSYSSSKYTPSLKADIAAAITDLTAKILHKDPKVTAIIVKSVDPADWFAGGKSLAEHKLASFWLDIHVTEGTNTKDEKAAYIAAMFTRMGELLGPLHNESYLHVDEVRGDAYGFGGLTQERRYIAGKLQVAPQGKEGSASSQIVSGKR
jgi:4-oxalocrotonate tautomerase